MSATERVLQILQTALSLSRPFSNAAVGTALGVDLAEGDSGNPYLRVFRAAHGPAPLSAVEVREPIDSGRQLGMQGMVRLGFDVSGVTPDAVRPYVGPLTNVLVPHPNDPDDSFASVHPQEWGEIRVGYAPDTKTLRSIVLDPARVTT